MIYYVYTHTFSNGTRYIGKGKGYRATHFRNRNRFWTNLYDKYGKPVVEITIPNLTNTEALFYEQRLIQNYKICGIPLCNLTEGGEGEGHPHSLEHRATLKTHNPNAKIINVYDETGTLCITYNGTLTATTDDIPKYAFVASYKHQGRPLGYTKASRFELRKRLHQRFIGWYALEAGHSRKFFPAIPNVRAEQLLGLTSKLSFAPIKDHNPNAKHIQVFDAADTLYCTSYGNFAETCKALNLPKALLEKAKRTQQPINTKRTKYKHLNGFTVKYKKDPYENL